jgi:hypothetical protein
MGPNEIAQPGPAERRDPPQRRPTLARGADRRLAVLLFAAAFLLPVAPAAVAPGSAVAAECAGDECQSPPPPPEDPTPGTSVVEGPSNPPVRFPQTHKKKPSKGGHRHKHRHGGRGR